MKHILLTFIYCITAIFFSGCETEPSSGDVIYIDLQQSLNQHNIEDLAASIHLVPLETNDSCLIKQIGKVRVEDNGYYIYDYNDSPIKRFSKEGCLISEIGKKGQGPGEFIQITDFFVQKDTVNILAWSGNKKWIRMQNNNTFLYETDMSFPLDEFHPMNDSCYFLHVGNGTIGNTGRMNSYLYSIDKDFQIKEKRYPKTYPYGSNYYYCAQTHFFRESGDAVLYRRDFNDTIYSITASLEITPKYKLDFGKKWYSQKALKDNSGKGTLEIEREFDKKQYPKFIYFAESNHHLMVTYTRNEQNSDIDYVSVYARTSGLIYNFRVDDKSILKLFANLQSYSGDSFYSFIKADDFLNMAANLTRDNPFYEKMTQLSQNVNDTDNPLLVFFEFKENISP